MKNINNIWLMVILIMLWNVNADWNLDYDTLSSVQNMTTYMPCQETGAITITNTSGNLNMTMDGGANNAAAIFFNSSMQVNFTFVIEQNYPEGTALKQVGIWSTYWMGKAHGTCQANIKPLSLDIDTCNYGGSGDPDCCLWATNGSTPRFVVDNISLDNSCSAFDDESCVFTFTNPDGTERVTLHVNCTNYTWSEDSWHMDMFANGVIYPSHYINSLDPNDRILFSDYMYYEGTDALPENISTCSAQYSSIVHSNTQTLSSVTTGTPTNVIFEIDDVNFSYDSESGGKYFYAWSIEGETLGTHNVTCYAVYGGHTESLLTDFSVRYASVTVTVFDASDNPLSGVAVYVMQNSTDNVTFDVTSGEGELYFELMGDELYSYTFIAEDIPTTMTIRNDTLIEIHTSSLYGTFVLHPYLNDIWDSTTCGPQNYIEFDSVYTNKTYTIQGLDCGTDVYYLNVEAGTYAVGWWVGPINTQVRVEPTAPPSIWGGIQSDIFLYGHIDWDNPINNPVIEYDTSNYLFSVYDENGYAPIENATINIWDCIEVGSDFLCADFEGGGLTNASGELYKEITYSEFNEIVIRIDGYNEYREIVTPDQIKYARTGGCGEGSCGNIDILINYTAYLIPNDYYYFILDITDCDDDADLENVTITCNSFSNIFSDQTNSSGEAKFYMPSEDLTENPIGLYAACQILYLDYLPMSIQDVFYPYETYDYCLDSLTDNHNLLVKVYSGTDNITNARVDVVCFDSIVIEHIVKQYTIYTNSTGEAYFTSVPRRSCNVFTSKPEYRDNSTYRFDMFDHDNKTLELYKTISGQLYMQSYIDFYGSSDRQFLDYVDTTWTIFNDSECNNDMYFISKTSGSNGHVQLEQWVNTGSHFQITASKSGYQDYTGPCLKAAYTHTEQIPLSLLSGGISILMKSYQTCNNSRIILNDVWVSIRSEWTGVTMGPYHIIDYQYAINAQEGVYVFIASKKINNTVIETIESYGNFNQDATQELIFQQCFVGQQNDILDKINQEQRLSEAQNLAYAFLPIFVVLLLLGAMKRV